ncbi:hypothetical protein U9R90_24975 [Streptomyces sp. E11-3]|uniref:hypothetical protein n=1 Tax=Streptomyces sp. E11-3 TaxID=3110112 RepID=UPI00397EF7B0
MADDDQNPQPPATGEPNNEPPASTPTGDQGGSELGDAGKKAIAEEREARRAAEKTRKELEARLKELEPLAAKAKQLEDSKKSESEKLTEKLTAAEKRAAASEERALRLEVATAKGLTPAQAKRLVGASKEELEADADELLASFGGDSGGGKGKGGKKPVEHLRPGGAPNPPEPSLAQRIADAEKAGKWADAQQLKAQQLMQLANPNQ